MHHAPSSTGSGWRAAALLAALALPMAACAGGEDTDDPAADVTAPAESGNAQLDVTDFSFSNVSAPAGGTLEVVNSSGGSHTVTADDGAFDEPLADDETIELTVPAEPGEYPFHCEIHPDMTATLTAE